MLVQKVDFLIPRQSTKTNREIETALNITDEIIRYLIVKPDYKGRDFAESEKTRKAKNRRDDDVENSDRETEE